VPFELPDILGEFEKWAASFRCVDYVHSVAFDLSSRGMGTDHFDKLRDTLRNHCVLGRQRFGPPGGTAVRKPGTDTRLRLRRQH
jgi:hypothetical protein